MTTMMVMNTTNMKMMVGDGGDDVTADGLDGDYRHDGHDGDAIENDDTK